ncbi:ubiquinone/menaquinone biosynthesis methyltransferase [Colletotrichum lupini]|uniref:2-methoxy-6-polyprenyl-1,4-benzoquinol methylase, mitochondrial n=3 Tax=Colletotrichum acutatum species complex TaxID=2707335 RepID=A0A9Q8SB44_9PEZI|nr:ubiquinone/menaquinone biosynthesis methyltransferase [Colletotrichum lupini]UQC73646.1 ubiquinone/menaquinone biosynthesis methyltransferase [Colletotrichum lupini]
MTPAGSIALLVILVIALICTIIWLAKDQVHTFVKALADHRAAPTPNPQILHQNLFHPGSSPSTHRLTSLRAAPRSLHASSTRTSHSIAMATRRALRSSWSARSLSNQLSTSPSPISRPFAIASRSINTSTDPSADGKTTHFGFKTVPESEKADRVAGVFHSVADSYDRMNDLMSFGWHRIWKDHFVSGLQPGLSASNPPTPQHILDIAGGTGDIAFRMLHTAHNINHNPDVRVTISDINPSMLAVGRDRSRSLPASQQAAMSWLEANAEKLPEGAIKDNSIDLYTVAFGIRNFTNIPAALREAHRVLKPGGVFACLEFSKADDYPLFNAIYKRWSFSGIPLIGQLVAGDRDSYQYLVESIERFPSQTEFRDMIKDAGFVVSGEGYENLTGGVAAIHKGMKPIA